MNDNVGRDRPAVREVTPAMMKAGAEVIYEADWNFSSDAEDVAARIYSAMRALEQAD